MNDFVVQMEDFSDLELIFFSSFWTSLCSDEKDKQKVSEPLEKKISRLKNFISRLNANNSITNSYLFQGGGVGSTLGSASSPFIPSSDYSPHPVMRTHHSDPPGIV